MNCYSIFDKELGEIIIKPYPSALRFIFRVQNQKLVITTPVSTTEKTILKIISEHKTRLKHLLSNSTDKKLKDGDIIETLLFKIYIRASERRDMHFVLSGDSLTITYPARFTENDKQVQLWIKKGICRYLKQSAEHYLIDRAYALAKKTGATFKSVAITHGKKRLGKCDSKKNISLSYYLMFLPDHLIDYVIFHEMAHLKEMNHGCSFHNLCDFYCGGEEKMRIKELKKFIFPID